MGNVSSGRLVHEPNDRLCRGTAGSRRVEDEPVDFNVILWFRTGSSTLASKSTATKCRHRLFVANTCGRQKVDRVVIDFDATADERWEVGEVWRATIVSSPLWVKMAKPDAPVCRKFVGVTEWVSEKSYTSQMVSMCTWSFGRRVFQGNHLQWQWQLITQNKQEKLRQKHKLAIYK